MKTELDIENSKLESKFKKPIQTSVFEKNTIIIDEKPAKTTLKTRVKRGSMFTRSNLERECVESDCTPEEYLEGAENYIPRKKLWKGRDFSKTMFQIYYTDCVKKCNKENPTSTDILVCQTHLTKKSGYMVFLDFNGNTRNQKTRPQNNRGHLNKKNQQKPVT